jgi:hypothetical protein
MHVDNPPCTRVDAIITAPNERRSMKLLNSAEGATPSLLAP